MLTEAQFATQVVDLLNLYHWRWTHFRAARTLHGWVTALSGQPGFPDIVAVRAPRQIIAELKSQGGKLSAEQEAWLYELHRCEGVEVYVWRPDEIERIEEVLAATATSKR